MRGKWAASLLILLLASPSHAGEFGARLGSGISELYVYDQHGGLAPLFSLEVFHLDTHGVALGAYFQYNYLPRTERSPVHVANYGILARGHFPNNAGAVTFRADPIMMLLVILCGANGGTCGAGWGSAFNGYPFPLSVGLSMDYSIPLTPGIRLRPELGIRYFFSPIPFYSAGDVDRLRLLGLDLGASIEF